MPLIGQIIYICLQLASLEQLFDAIDWSRRQYLLVFCRSGLCLEQLFDAIYRSAADIAQILQVGANYLMPLAVQIIDICLYFAILQQLFDASDRSAYDLCLNFTLSSLRQLFDAIIRSESVRSLIFACTLHCQVWKSGAISRCHSSVRSSIIGRTDREYSRVLPLWSNCPLPLIGRIVDTCLHVVSLEQLLDALDRSDR